MDLFFSLPDDAGAAMVRMMLEGSFSSPFGEGVMGICNRGFVVCRSSTNSFMPSFVLVMVCLSNRLNLLLLWFSFGVSPWALEESKAGCIWE
ncbi:hypothetical protein BUALT_Bualt05G0114000 [Buddleja alternifolia]|uniref:NADH dehydrogenase subunit 1 n=1 Tax=Buddleja alternifolia TaxID=168488 RepID=A0AAV6XIG8_9LAMI|nr:hypothetical protein BUALT_Bualt05G0114000 [Buddleja alternifolia]